MIEMRNIARRGCGGVRSKVGAVVLGALLVLAAAPAQAADSNKKFAIKGLGVAPCSVFVKALSGNDKGRLAAFNGWMEGYLTAANRLESATYDLVAWRSRGRLLRSLGAYCKKNPKTRFGRAVMGLVASLKTGRIRTRSGVIESRSGDKKARVYRETMRRAQRALARLGFYAGKIDGRFGPNTRLGLEAFQQKEKIEVTGIPNQRTLSRLFRKPPSGAAAR